MGHSLNIKDFNLFLEKLGKEYNIYAPVVHKGKGAFSDTDSIRYSKVTSFEDVVFDKKSDFSPKEIMLPITQTLFYFTEDSVMEPKTEEKKALIFMRACDINAVKRVDEIYLRNGAEDNYYKAARDKVKFVLMECEASFENCFCVSMESNKTEDYSLFLRMKSGEVEISCRDKEFEEYFASYKEVEIEPVFIEENEIKVIIPENLDEKVMKSKMWAEYSERCIACGRCNFVCGTCTCFTMQDIFYKDNLNAGERRRVWASCHIDGYTDMAGGHVVRRDKGERMRFKVMHKVYDFKKRFGYHMCVGCGRCDDVCPEYISFSNCVNKLSAAMEEVE